MQLISSPNISTPKWLNLHPIFRQPASFHKSNNPIQIPSASAVVNEGGSESGFLSAIGRVIEEQEYRKSRAEVNRQGLDLQGYSIEGLSIGGQETCVIVPELKSAFDIGRQVMTTESFYHIPDLDFKDVLLKFGHAKGPTEFHVIWKVGNPRWLYGMDNLGGLPMYVATRGLYSLKPPTIFVPPCIKEDVEQLFEIHRTMGQVELNLDLVALDVGETYEMRSDLVVRPFKTQHVIASQGYVIYSVRKKLRKQYMHLKGKQIEKLKKSGVEITDTILCPEVAFTGDTTSDFFLDPRSADALRAKILITEATFLDENVSVEHAREHGHTHLYEIMEHAQWIRNKALVLTHFSSRYHIEDIRQAVAKLQSKDPTRGDIPSFRHISYPILTSRRTGGRRSQARSRDKFVIYELAPSLRI
ncbi:ribonuclease Z, chloroplastic [Dorcoceras hygrometricum]|uniref:Ribonuclease Z, chloroplastic n=1 Tax=Dorcoceras hygrometricum TaxID=472368 RepID=A0A2Z7ABM2_9LAMI|nr:ribonuclease Z, chloroplastic [Dorcoceras hygrometricum]